MTVIQMRILSCNFLDEFGLDHILPPLDRHRSISTLRACLDDMTIPAQAPKWSRYSGFPKWLLDFRVNVVAAEQVVSLQLTKHRQFTSRACPDAPLMDHASGLAESGA